MGKKKINIPLEIIDEEQNTSAHDSPRLVPGKNGGTLTPFNSITARAAVQARIDKKRAVIQQAAQDAVERGDLLGKYGNEAWLAEVTQAQMKIATTPEAGKSAVMAASWLVDNTGMGEKQATADSGADTMSAAADMFRAMASFAASIPADVVDAVPVDVDA